MNYQSTFTVSPQAGATGTWSFVSSLLPHPIAFMYMAATDSVGTVYSMFNNTQVTGATHTLKYAAWKAMVQRWRLAYMSVTCYQDGPDLSNQGTIVVCQPPISKYKFTGAIGNTATNSLISVPVVYYSSEDYPQFNEAQAMPNAYFNRSREGAYVPLKLTKTCQQWHGESDEVFHSSGMSGTGVRGTFYLPNTTAVADYPIIDVERAWVHWNAGNVDALGGASTSDMCNDTFAHICASNLSVATSFTFFVRCGFEVQCQPESGLTPQLKLSPKHDPVALKTYFAIARELKDGYPADYNDAGKIWDVISSVLKGISPGLSAIPIIGPALAAGVPLAATFGDQIRGEVQRRKDAKAAKKQLTAPQQSSSTPAPTVATLTPKQVQTVVSQAGLEKLMEQVARRRRSGRRSRLSRRS